MAVNIGYKSGRRTLWLIDAAGDCLVSRNKALAWDFKREYAAKRALDEYLTTRRRWFVMVDGRITYNPMPTERLAKTEQEQAERDAWHREECAEAA